MMKRAFLGLGSIVVAAGAVVFVACGEDTPAGPTPDAGCFGVTCQPAPVCVTDPDCKDPALRCDTSTGVARCVPIPALPDAGVDASKPDAAPDASDGGKSVIVGCVPQEVSTRYDASWLFGNGCQATWNGANQLTIAASAVKFSGFEGTITAADAKTGALFAASDGIDLYDGTGTKRNTVPLGSTTSTSQPAAFIGKPGAAGAFYLVTNAANVDAASPGGLYVSNLDCGSVTPSAAPVLVADTESYTEALATVRHANDVDRFILSAAPTGMAVVPVTAAGVGAPTITPWGAALSGVVAHQRASIVFARDRKTFAVTAEHQGLVVGTFDNATGAISGLTAITLPTHTTLYSAAFSSNGSKLYVSEWNGKLWQVDRANANAVVEIGTAGGQVRLAIDDKVYVASYAQSALGVIANANQPAASVTITSAALPTGCTSSFGFPGLGDL